jgi:hypothetical protein
MLKNDADKLNGMRTYIDGKMRRYDLLFAVNGGAFVIWRLEPATPGPLNILTLAVAAMFFTVVMTVDVWVFAQGLKQDFFESRDNVFNPIGKIILILLGSLLVVAWGLAAQLPPIWIVLAVAFLVVCTGLGHLWIRKHPANPSSTGQA